MASDLPPVTSYLVPKKVQKQLEALNKGTGLSLSYLVAEAIIAGVPIISQRHPILDEPIETASGHHKK